MAAPGQSAARIGLAAVLIQIGLMDLSLSIDNVIAAGDLDALTAGSREITHVLNDAQDRHVDLRVEVVVAPPADVLGLQEGVGAERRGSSPH